MLIMIEKVKQTITKYGLLRQNDRVVVGVSGGPDSAALAVTLAQIAPSMGVRLIAAHFNHGLRGREANEDERSASRLAKKLGLSFVSRKMDNAAAPKGVSPEDYYRQQRYQFFDEVAKSNHACKIALGHNLQDQAEAGVYEFRLHEGLVLPLPKPSLKYLSANPNDDAMPLH